MKTLKVACLVCFLTVIFASTSLVSAFSAGDATAQAFWSTATPSPGSTVTLTINFESSYSESIRIYRIGIHADWQESGQYYTLDLSDDPQTVESGGLYVARTAITIPASVRLGEYSYIISVDGVDQSGGSVMWDSSSYTVTIGEGSSQTTGPNSTGNPNTSTGGGIDSFIIYIAVIAVVAVVAVLLAVVIVKRKSRPAAAPTARPVPPPSEMPPPESPKPEQKPEEKDFTI